MIDLCSRCDLPILCLNKEKIKKEMGDKYIFFLVVSSGNMFQKISKVFSFNLLL